MKLLHLACHALSRALLSRPMQKLILPLLLVLFSFGKVEAQDLEGHLYVPATMCTPGPYEAKFYVSASVKSLAPTTTTQVKLELLIDGNSVFTKTVSTTQGYTQQEEVTRILPAPGVYSIVLKSEMIYSGTTYTDTETKTFAYGPSECHTVTVKTFIDKDNDCKFSAGDVPAPNTDIEYYKSTNTNGEHVESKAKDQYYYFSPAPYASDGSGNFYGSTCLDNFQNRVYSDTTIYFGYNINDIGIEDISHRSDVDNTNPCKKPKYAYSWLAYKTPRSAVQIRWTFGDGTDSVVTRNPDFHWKTDTVWMSHSYNSAGDYPTSVSIISEGDTILIPLQTVTVPSNCGNVSGTVYREKNGDCTKAATGENPLGHHRVALTHQDGSIETTFVDLVTGEYKFQVENNASYSVQLCEINPDGQIYSPFAKHDYTCVLSHQKNQPESGLDFGIERKCDSIYTDYEVVGRARRDRPGFTSTFSITAINNSSSFSPATIYYTLHNLETFESASVAPSRINGMTLEWDVSGDQYYNFIEVDVKLSQSAVLGDTLCRYVWVHPTDQDALLNNNQHSFCNVIGASYDPNDKTVYINQTGEEGSEILANHDLTYRVRFQNTGTDVAENIYILDTIDDNLDLRTLQFIGASHPMKLYIKDRVIRFEFSNIMLPDDKTDEPGSHGELFYTIKLNQDLPVGTKIENTAYIYFDYNEPIITNTAVSTIVEPVSPTDAKFTTTERSCAASDGSLKIDEVIGGEAPFQYSLNGLPFQSSTSFANLDAGNYTLQVKGSNGGVYSENVTIGTTPSPTQINHTVVPSGCGTPNGRIEISTTQGGTAPYEYSIDNSVFSASTSLGSLTVGNHLLAVKDSKGCTYSANVAVGKLSGPTAATTNITPDFCEKTNGTVTISSVTGGSSPFEYSADGLVYQSNTTLSNLSGQAHTIYVRDGAECVFQKTITVPSQSGITGFATDVVQESCGNKNGEISVKNVVGGVSPFRYALNGSTDQSSSSFTTLSAGAHQVSVIDQNGCSFTNSVTVGAVSNITSINPVITPATCSLANGSLTATAGGVSGPVSWQIDGGTIGTSNSFVNLSVGSHTLTAIDENQCAASITVVIPDTPGPSSISSSITASGCVTSGVANITGVTGGTAPYEYSISGQQYSGINNFTGLGPNTYSVSVRDANGCIYTESIIIGVTSSPTAIQSTLNNASCGQSNGSVVITGVTDGTGPYEYSLNSSPFSTASTINGLSANVYSLSVRDANQCTFQTTVQLMDDAGPSSIAISVASSYCGKNVGQITLGAVTGGKAPYVYSLDNSAFTSTTSYTNLSPTTYAVVVRDITGCLYSSSVTVAEIAGPSNIQAVPTDDICGKGIGKIKVANVSGTALPFTYSTNGSSFQSSDLFENLTTGTYTVHVRDNNGCETSVASFVGSISGPGQAGNVVINEPHCGQSDGRVQVNVSSISGGVAPYSIQIQNTVDPASGIFTGLSANIYDLRITDQNNCVTIQQITLNDVSGPVSAQTIVQESTCNLSNGSVQIHNIDRGTAPFEFADASGTYQASNLFAGLSAANGQLFYVRDNAGCVLELSVSIPSAPGPSDILAELSHENCSLTDGALKDLRAIDGKLPMSFVINNQFTASQNGSVTGLSVGDYTVVVTDANNCSFTKSFSLLNLPAPIAEFSASEENSEAPASIGFRAKEVPNCTYRWDFGDGSSSQLISPIYTFNTGGKYEVQMTITNTAGCSSSFSKEINVRPSVTLFIPNSFTPNKDGNNDVFEVRGENLVTFTMKIYNKWSEHVATITESSPGWDGNYMNEECRSDVYLYNITAVDIKGKQHVSTGKISLIR